MKNKTIQISGITLSDIPALQNLGKQTFYETFAWGNTEENIQIYLDATFSVKNLESEVRNKNCRLYFAKNDNHPVGYIKINFGPAQGEFRDENGLEIEKLYVLPEFQGMGIGKKLLEQAIEIAAEKRLDFIWLGVWEKNEKAIRFYEKNGFVSCGSHSFMVGNDEQNDILMKLTGQNLIKL